MLPPPQNVRICFHKTPRKAFCLLALSAVLVAGCSTTQSSPFSMYSSPLLDGDMRAQRTHGTSLNAISTQSPAPASPVYVRQSHPKTNARAQSNAPPTKQSSPAHTALATTAPTTITPAINRSTNGSLAHAADYAWTTYTANHVDLPQEARTNIATLYRACREHGKISHNTPRPGDLAFFHNTFDANKDTRNNDWYTHVAIVENVAPNGQISLLGYQDQHVQRFHMNLEQLERQTSPNGTIVNSALRPKTNQDAPFTQYLSSQLFAGYCSMLPKQQDFTAIDTWQPAQTR